MERRKPWLFEHKLHSDPEHLHEWSHSLILAPELLPEEFSTSSPEDRLARVERRFEALLSENRAQLDEIANLLGKRDGMALSPLQTLRFLLPMLCTYHVGVLGALLVCLVSACYIGIFS